MIIKRKTQDSVFDIKKQLLMQSELGFYTDIRDLFEAFIKKVLSVCYVTQKRDCITEVNSP